MELNNIFDLLIDYQDTNYQHPPVIHSNYLGLGPSCPYITINKNKL